MSYAGDNAAIRAADSPSIDAFSRWRISEPRLQFSAVFDIGLRPLHWETSTVGAGAVAFESAARHATLQVTNPTDAAVLRTRQPFIYRAGQSHLVLVTFDPHNIPAGAVFRAGYFADDGYFIEKAADGTLNIVERTAVTGSPVDTPVPQASWNLDTLDGSGGKETNPSGVTLDFAEAQIFLIDLQWLGVGRVRVGFDIDGVIIYVHEFNHANNDNPAPYIRTASLPIRYELVSVSAAAEARPICATVLREGGTEEPSVTRRVNSGNVSRTVGTDWTTVVGVRLDPTKGAASVARALSGEIFNLDATDPVEWMLISNPTDTSSAVWVDLPEADSVLEVSRSTIALTVDGNGDPSITPTLRTLGVGGFAPAAAAGRGVSSGQAAPDTIPFVVPSTGIPDEVWLVARVTATTAPVRGSITIQVTR